MKRNNKIHLFLDSGAFSAKTQGITINIKEYIAFIKDNLDIIGVYANLDVIGDAKATYINQKIMEREGLKPIPVYHVGEDEKWLIKYLESGYSYIALGGMVKGSASSLKSWLDHTWENHLIDPITRLPKVKIHGFGLTSLTLMLRYPWYSVDSTSWVMTSRMGGIMLPIWENGGWNYLKQPVKLAVSNQSSDLSKANAHFETMSPTYQKIMKKYLDEKGYVMGKSEFLQVSSEYELKENERFIGKKVKGEPRKIERVIERGIGNDYKQRDEVNILYFIDLENNLPPYPQPFTYKSKTLF
jgi:hypothetical protein